MNAAHVCLQPNVTPVLRVRLMDGNTSSEYSILRVQKETCHVQYPRGANELLCVYCLQQLAELQLLLQVQHRLVHTKIIKGSCTHKYSSQFSSELRTVRTITFLDCGLWHSL